MGECCRSILEFVVCEGNGHFLSGVHPGDRTGYLASMLDTEAIS